MLFVRFQYQLEVVGICPFQLDFPTFQLDETLAKHLGLCMWVRAMETYDRVAKAGMGDGWSGNGYYFGNPHIGTYLGIHQTSSKRMVNLRGFLFSRW